MLFAVTDVVKTQPQIYLKIYWTRLYEIILKWIYVTTKVAASRFKRPPHALPLSCE